jgi:ribonucleoside-diphosphate reductase alpha chain
MFLKNQGVPNEPAIGKEETTTVFSFYIKAPEGSIKRTDITALQHLEDWKFLQTYWCEHKPSCTINVKEDEWLKVGAWVYENFDHVSGLSFLPYDTGIYKQAPYQTLTEDEYNKLYREITLDWSELDVYEKGLDTTKGASSMACSGDVCEIVDIST